MTKISVRDAVLADAHHLGDIHVAAWQAAYADIVDTSYLDELNPVDRARRWRAAIEQDPSPKDFRRLVVEVDGVVVGFALVGAARRNDETGLGELMAVNLDPRAWGIGAGTSLLDSAVRELRDGLGFSEAILWVAQGNARARRFYERESWVLDGGTKTDTIGGVSVPELRYRRRLYSGRDRDQLWPRNRQVQERSKTTKFLRQHIDGSRDH